MKICIFGADGRTGLEVVKKCLEKKHEVTAFVYTPKAKEYLPEDINIIVGDVLKEKDVFDAVQGSDAVISVVGHIKNSDPLMQTKGITNIKNAMNEYGIKRIVSLTGTGVRTKGDNPSLFDRIGNFMIKLIDKERIVDGIKHTQVLEHSDLDWTLVRVLKLSSAKTTDNLYKLTKHGPAEALTSRSKVANIITDLISSDDYIGEMPISS